MAAELLFESRLTNHILRQDGPMEEAPCLSLQLELTDGPILYVSGGAVVHPSAWTLKIRRCGPADPAPHVSGMLHYVPIGAKPRCVIEVRQSGERFAALLDMFKGGHASEITVTVDDLADKPDYSKFWNTALYPRIPLQSICFEFPLPQNEA